MEKAYTQVYEQIKAKIGTNPTREQLNELDNFKYAATNIKIPRSLLFYGCNGTGKSTFAEAAAREAGSIPITLMPTSGTFINDVMDTMKNARKLYSEEGIRTVIIINEIQEFIDTNFGVDNYINLTFMKSIIDHCSEKPNDEDKRASAVTFFFTTSYPKALSDIEIFSKSGRGNIIIPIEPARDENMKAVLKHHIQRVVNDRKIDFDVENYDFTELVNYLNPNEKGAYSCWSIKQAVSDATDKYIANPQKAFALHVLDYLKDTRDIQPNKLKEYNDEIESVMGNALSKIEGLILKREMGFITEKEEEELLILEEQMGVNIS